MLESVVRKSSGKLLHTVGPYTARDREPYLEPYLGPYLLTLTLGTISMQVSADRKLRRPDTVEVSMQSSAMYDGAAPCKDL